MRAARGALDRFVFGLLDRNDEVFLYTFATHVHLAQGWTTDRGRISSALERIEPRGNTALYDAVAEAVPLAQSGRNKKKALVIISDGNDTASMTDVRSLKRMIRETEVLVYAVGIDAKDGVSSGGGGRPPVWTPPRFPIPTPFPFPGRRRPPTQPPPVPQGPYGGSSSSGDQRVNVAALRDLTDDSGGRTEIIREAQDLDPATSGIADELSRQYYLGYPAAARKDGMWHTITVEVRNSDYRIRARRGYVASGN
jgi:VWFA-related protein